MRKLAPQIAILLAFQAALLAMIVERPVNLAALTVLAALFWLSGPGRRRWLLMTVLLALGTWSVVLGQGLFYAGVPRTALVRLVAPEWFPFGDPPGLYLYGEGLLHGLVQAFRFDVMILLGAGLLSRYATDQLTGGLRALRVPAPLCFLFSIALRFLPMMWEEARATWTAQHLRGFRLFAPGGTGGKSGAGAMLGAAQFIVRAARSPVRGLRVLLLPLVASNVRKADEIAAALLGRGFSPVAGNPAGGRGASAGERALCWSGALVLTGLAVALLLTRLHLLGIHSSPWLNWLYALVISHV